MKYGSRKTVACTKFQHRDQMRESLTVKGKAASNEPFAACKQQAIHITLIKCT